MCADEEEGSEGDRVFRKSGIPRISIEEVSSMLFILLPEIQVLVN
jgi:hypothetical protein